MVDDDQMENCSCTFQLVNVDHPALFYGQRLRSTLTAAFFSRPFVILKILIAIATRFLQSRIQLIFAGVKLICFFYVFEMGGIFSEPFHIYCDIYPIFFSSFPKLIFNIFSTKRRKTQPNTKIDFLICIGWGYSPHTEGNAKDTWY